MARYAIVSKGTVLNVTEWTPPDEALIAHSRERITELQELVKNEERKRWSPPAGTQTVLDESGAAQIGDTWDGEKFSPRT